MAQVKQLLGGDGNNETSLREGIIEKAGPSFRSKLNDLSVFKETLDLLDYIELRKLLKFWTGNTQLKGELKVEIVPYMGLPSASTCFNNLKISQNNFTNGASQLAADLRKSLEYGGVGTGLI